MSERYTSPETSRALADAGLSQAMSRAWWSMSLGDPFLNERSPYPVPTINNYDVRALDLTDVLHELTRPRPEEADARPLVSAWRMYQHEAGSTEMCVMRVGELYWRDFGGPTPVEAAAACLIALLRERAK